MLSFLFVLLLAIPAIAQQGVNCGTGPLTPAARSQGLNFHNILRASISQGRSSPGPRGGGRNIYMLRYDCGLEVISQNQALLCTGTTSAPQTRPGIGQNAHRFVQNLAQVPLNNAINFAATAWWDQVKRGYAAAADNVYTAAVAATGIESYAQMAWGATTRVGCGYQQCAGFRVVVCSYQTRGPIIGQPIVQPGVGCMSNADCTTFPGSTCNVALRSCNAPPGTNPVPPTGPTTAATTTAGAATACTGAPLFTAANRDAIVTGHNTLRQNIARGMTINGVVTRGCQNMFEMRYDCAMEAAAQVQADACDPAANPAQRGRNIHFNNANPDPAAAITAALAAWQGELVAAFVVNAPLSTTAGQPNEVAMFGQFGQMAFNRAWSVGCGYGRCNATAVQVVCRYRLPRSDTGKVWQATTTNVGCTQNRCAAINSTATCNTTTGLCRFP